MSRFEAKAAGQMGLVFANLPAGRVLSPMGLLAVDGVSCSMCHQILDNNLGQKSSYTAGFTVDTKTPLGQRRAFGPYQVDDGRRSLMRSSSRFLPTEATYIRESEICATCHTLYTEALDENSRVIGELPEQVPYLEWRQSAYKNSRSCQSCHMPVVDIEVPFTGVLGKPRSGVSRHVFRAGNFFIPEIFNAHRFELGVAALPQDLDAAVRRTIEHLETSSARLAIESVEMKQGRLKAQLSVENSAGHKLPTAYPSRRAWIHFTVRGRDDNRVIFESGNLNPDGSISGNDNDATADLYEPHYDRIERSDQVQIYEGILAGPDDKVTTVLLTAVRYVKDNRLLPDGFEKAAAEADISVKGAARDDDNFRGGRDRILYSVDVGNAGGPFHIQAELWYQPISYRWAHNLERQNAVETGRFVSYYNSLSGQSAVVLAKAVAMTPPEGSR
jgi:hypothetical protein